MPNSYSFPVAYQNMLDRIYKAEAVTSDLNLADGKYKFSATDAKTVYIKKLALQGLGNYTRDTGYDSGVMTVTWESHTMGQDRSKKFILDTMDSKEAYITIGEVASEFMRLHVIPEIDAYRIGKICSLCNTDTTGTLTYDTVIKAIRTGVKTLNDNDVPREGRILYVSSEVYQLMQESGEFFKSINVQNNNGVIDTQITSFDGMLIKEVPTSRFYTIFDFATSGAGGFTVNGLGKAINFMIVYKPEIGAVVKHTAPKLVTPELNQSADGWIYGFRMYHDLFIVENKLNGVYIHSKA
jgi:hypothetical protein